VLTSNAMHPIRIVPEVRKLPDPTLVFLLTPCRLYKR